MTQTNLEWFVGICIKRKKVFIKKPWDDDETFFLWLKGSLILVLTLSKLLTNVYHENICDANISYDQRKDKIIDSKGYRESDSVYT